MKTNVMTKTALLIGALIIYQWATAQTDVPEEDISPQVEDCNSTKLLGSYFLHLPLSSYLILDFDRVPISAIEVYSYGSLIYSGVDKYMVVPLRKNESYVVNSLNACGEMIKILDVESKVNKGKTEIEVPKNLYKILSQKLIDDNKEPLWEYLGETSHLKFVEKLYFIQEYYLGGDLGNIGGNTFESGVEDLWEFENLLNWSDFGEKIQEYVFKEPNRNCHCLAITPSSPPYHSIHGKKSINPFIKYSRAFDSGSKSYGRNKYFYWRDSTVGAAKSQRIKQYMKGSHTKKEEFTKPQLGGAGSSNQTVMSFTFYCEDINGVRDDCMCKNRKIVVYANYTSNVKALAKKVNCTFCGSGFAAFAQVEDWAILTKGSLKTSSNIIDAGRIRAFDNNYVSHNGQFKFKALDLVTEVLRSYAQYKLSGVVDTSTISRLKDQLESLIKQPLKSGGGSGVSVGVSYLIDEKGVAVEILPNDPTDIIVHSFSNHQFSGHTKWHSETWLQSSVGLAGYMNYEESAECCTDDVYKWIVGGNYQSDTEDRLRGVNYFFSSSGIVPKYGNLYIKKYTSDNESGYYIANRCYPFFNGPMASSVLPAGSVYVVRKLLDGEIVMKGSVKDSTDVALLKSFVEYENLSPGYYVIEAIIENQIVKYKIKL